MLWPVRMCYGRCTLFRTGMSGFRRRWILGVSQRGLEVKCEELGPHAHTHIYIYIYLHIYTCIQKPVGAARSALWKNSMSPKRAVPGIGGSHSRVFAGVCDTCILRFRQKLGVTFFCYVLKLSTLSISFTMLDSVKSEL